MNELSITFLLKGKNNFPRNYVQLSDPDYQWSLDHFTHVIFWYDARIFEILKRLVLWTVVQYIFKCRLINYLSCGQLHVLSLLKREGETDRETKRNVSTQTLPWNDKRPRAKYFGVYDYALSKRYGRNQNDADERRETTSGTRTRVHEAADTREVGRLAAFSAAVSMHIARGF